MPKRWFEFVLYAAVSSLMLAAAFISGYYTRSLTGGEGSGYPLLAEAQRIIDANYIGDLPDQTAVEYGLIRGLVGALDDPYTVFVEPQQAELDSDNLQGAFGGIGSLVQQNEAGEFVLSPLPESPAALAGIMEGDILLTVDGVMLTSETSLDEVVARVRGEIGTNVTLTIRTGEDAPRQVSVTRAKFEIPSTTWQLYAKDETVGIIDVDRFSERTPDEVEQAVEELLTGGATGLVLDLRGNGGGLLDAGVSVAGLFLDGGDVLHEVRRDRPEKTFEADKGGAAEDYPIVVLIDGGTASASEIVAGALHDRGRAALIGQSTFGKGSVQLVFELSDGSSLHVTNARWFTPNRTPIDGTGLQPDIVVEGSDGDPALARAAQYLRNLP